jgi:hypothetical protein
LTGSSGSVGKEAKQTVVVVELPEGREYVWPPAISAMVSWKAGERVRYRGARWRVVSCTNGSDVLTVTLTPDESDLVGAAAPASDD